MVMGGLKREASSASSPLTQGIKLARMSGGAVLSDAGDNNGHQLNQTQLTTHQPLSQHMHLYHQPSPLDRPTATLLLQPKYYQPASASSELPTGASPAYATFPTPLPPASLNGHYDLPTALNPVNNNGKAKGMASTQVTSSAGPILSYNMLAAGYNNGPQAMMMHQPQQLLQQHPQHETTTLEAINNNGSAADAGGNLSLLLPAAPNAQWCSVPAASAASDADPFVPPSQLNKNVILQSL